MKIIDLTHIINEKTLNFRGNPGCCFKTIWNYDQCTTLTKFKVQYLDMSAGLGTHIDSPAHCFPHTDTVENTATGIIYDTLIFDVTQYCQKNFSINLEIITNSLFNDLNTSLQNKFIIIKTGWGKKWGSKEYFNNYLFPHITKETAQYFADHKIAGIGIDTLSPDAVTEEGYYPAHEILLSKNIFIVENIANLHLINIHQCQCIVAPLKIVSTESPIRLVALISD